MSIAYQDQPLTPHHRDQLIQGSGIAEDVIAERPYRSLTSPQALVTLPKLGFSTQVARLGSGLLFPLTVPDDPIPLYQFRPDKPQNDERGNPRKYEIPYKRPQRLILHPRTIPQLRSGTLPLYVTEGAKKVDSLISRGAIALGGIGVWSFTVKRTAAEKKRGTRKVLLPDWQLISLRDRSVIIVFDSDAALNTDVDTAEAELGALLRAQGAQVSRVRLPAAPDGTKQGIDDFFAHGHALADVEARTEPLPRPRFETMSAPELYHKRLAPARWVIPGKLPVGATLFYGRGKDGKSLMAWNIAMAVATGGRALGAYEVEAGQVLYLALEEGERRGQQRLFGQMDHAGMLTPPARLQFTFWRAPRLDEGFLERLETWLDDYPEGRLVIIDILEKVRPARTRDGMYADDYRALEALQEFGQRHNLGILVVHHSNKSKPEDFRDMVNGSTGLTGGCDTIWALRRAAGSPDATLHVSGRDVEEEDLALRFQDGFWTSTGEGATVHMREERQEILKVLAQAPQPLSPIQIALALDKPVNAIKQLLRKMLMAGSVIQPAFGVYALPHYSPPTDNSDNSHNCDNCGNCDNFVSNQLETQKLSSGPSPCHSEPGPGEELPLDHQELSFSAKVIGEQNTDNSFQPLEKNGTYEPKNARVIAVTPHMEAENDELRHVVDNVEVKYEKQEKPLTGIPFAPPDCLPEPPASRRYCVHDFVQEATGKRCTKCDVLFPEKFPQDAKAPAVAPKESEWPFIKPGALCFLCGNPGGQTGSWPKCPACGGTAAPPVTGPTQKGVR
jgi:AAA domain-containing protein/uncharacterized protein DUF3854